MQVLIGVFVTIIIMGPGLSSFGNELFAQRSPIGLTSINGNYTISEQENSVCSEDDFNANKSRNTIFYGGVVPFVAIPDTELSTEDSFFNDESFSFFLYFKRKF